MKDHTSFKKLIELSKTPHLSFSLESIHSNNNLNFVYDDSLKFSNHYHPWSIRESEADILFNIITQNNLQVGFELCTGVGISAIIAGQAFNNTGGKLISLDAYVEEIFNNCGAYNTDTKIVKKAESADGYVMTNYLISQLEISENIILDIGWSPDDVPMVYTKHHGNNKFDYAFIDGGHTIKQVQADVQVLLPYLDDRCVIVFHDFGSYCYETSSMLQEKYGFVNCKNYNTPFNLVAFSRGDIIL